MRFIRFTLKDDPFQEKRLGILRNGLVFDLRSAYSIYLQEKKLVSERAADKLSSEIFSDNLVRFLELGQFSMSATKELLAFSKGSMSRNHFNKDDVHLLSPIEYPPNIRDFIAFEAHIKNARAKRNLDIPPEWYKAPTYYRGTTSGIIGPNEIVKWPKYTEKLDYELEIACIIGKGGENINKENAEDHIFGYTIMNDFSARDIQMREMSVGLGPGKGKDFATALGPYIITKEEIGNPYNLTMKAYVNGELWSEGNTGSIHWSFPEMIEYASQSERILPGDVFGSGTVGLGCGLELGKYIKPNDLVELRIEKLGSLINKVVK